MTLDEFTHILEVYGSDAEQWPDSQREACLHFTKVNTQAKALLASYQQLDAKLNTIAAPSFPGLEQRVLTQSLPAKQSGLLDSIINWLLPEADSWSDLWRPATAACLPLVLGIVVGNFYSFGITVEDDGFQYWDDELLMLSFNEYSGEQQ
ncbi:MAG: hypothetical protein MI746_10230 [Pseudomonadales bacterium]|nr:hypothetical protein [Pseudomonadales bacterium]